MNSETPHNNPFFKPFRMVLTFLVCTASFPVCAMGDVKKSTHEDKKEGINDTIILGKEPDGNYKQAIFDAVIEQLVKNEDRELQQAGNQVETNRKAGADNNVLLNTDLQVDKKQVKAINNAPTPSTHNSTDNVLPNIAKKRKPITVRKLGSNFSSGDITTINFILNSQQSHKVHTKSGWIYLGRLTSRGWFRKTLDLKRSLPKIGKHYTVMQALNLRIQPPAKEGVARLITKLKTNDHVKILQVRRSGTKGHYWAKVQVK